MCLLVFAIDCHPKYQLILAANRDEFYERQTAQAHWWNESPRIFSGRDVLRGGTWLGVSEAGRIAAVTNFRQGYRVNSEARSRGLLVTDFLRRSDAPLHYFEEVKREALHYDGFNLIAGDAQGFFCFSNRGDGVTKITAGVHALSNHLLDTPWPKLIRSRQAFAAAVDRNDSELINQLFAVLADRSQAEDHELPDTGISKEWEKQLSSTFIALDNYGTRSSTVVLIGHDDTVIFEERNFDRAGNAENVVRQQFKLLRPNA
ncbi:MAG: NRDE family protein [Burkholderiales bacterium]